VIADLKEQMAEAVLERAKAFIQSAIADVAQSREPLTIRIRKVATAFDQIYAGGHNPCVLGKLAVADIGTTGHRLARDTFQLWADAIAELARDSGMPATRARQFAEDWIARVQGSLIVHSANGNRKPFERALSALAQLAQKKVGTTPPRKQD
jgi:TetR/AcrR family transcriptional repressor of lmrAB and yxaGH operons